METLQSRLEILLETILLILLLIGLIGFHIWVLCT